MVGTNWLEVGGIAELIAAVATLSLAGVTALMAKRTHEVAEKTEGLVEVSVRHAEATEQLAEAARTDRELAWRPQLGIISTERRGDGFSCTIRNTGPGPASQVMCLRREMENIGNWWMIPFNNMVAGEDQTSGAGKWSDGGSLYSPFDVPGDFGPQEAVTMVVLCSDVLGRRFRWAYAESVAPDQRRIFRALPAEACHEDFQPLPAWAQEPLIWG